MEGVHAQDRRVGGWVAGGWVHGSVRYGKPPARFGALRRNCIVETPMIVVIPQIPDAKTLVYGVYSTKDHPRKFRVPNSDSVGMTPKA